MVYQVRRAQGQLWEESNGSIECEEIGGDNEMRLTRYNGEKSLDKEVIDELGAINFR